MTHGKELVHDSDRISFVWKCIFKIMSKNLASTDLDFLSLQMIFYLLSSMMKNIS